MVSVLRLERFETFGTFESFGAFLVQYHQFERLDLSQYKGS
jgi:hypothetical protein